MDIYSQELVEFFKKYKPKTIEDALRKTCLPFCHLGTGVFRSAYLIEGVGANRDIVAKFPIQDKKPELNIKHSKQEMDNIKWIQRTQKFFDLWKHLPKFYYWDARSGVSLMPRYEMLEAHLTVNNLARYDELVQKLKRIDYGRVDKDQIGIDDDGILICLDFGHIGEQRREWNKRGRFCL